MKTIPERYFIIIENESMEVNKSIFNNAYGEIATERHTIFTNGVSPICHTKD